MDYIYIQMSNDEQFFELKDILYKKATTFILLFINNIKIDGKINDL